jgi:ribosomal protein S18 acetylase RimI-like enzyme
MRSAARGATRKGNAVDWKLDSKGIDWKELSVLYRIAPLGEKSADDLRTAFFNSRYVCFVFDDGRLVAAGRALADGIDCAYICDVAVHPDVQGSGLGKAVIARLRDLSAGHRKILLYAKPGKEGFYLALGFRRMRTAMAIFADQGAAARAGYIDQD